MAGGAVTGACMFEEWLQNRSNRVPFNKIWLLSMRRLAQNLREIRMPADLANRFVANMTLLNAKKRAPIFDVVGVRRDTNPIEPPASEWHRSKRGRRPTRR